MHVLTAPNPIILWQDVIKEAEDSCAIKLEHELEAYLVYLLYRYTDKPDMLGQVFAKAFLQAMQLTENQRNFSLQQVGDQCLLFAGLFPRIHQHRSIKIAYFVEIGRAAYLNISNHSTNIYSSLGAQFVLLMDILQSIRQPPDLMPLEAYDQWKELGSIRALTILQSYTKQYKKD